MAASTLAVPANSVFKHITIDGSFADWAGVAPAFEDAQDSTNSADYKAIYVAHDDDYLYIRFTLHTPNAQFTSHENIFIDADNNSLTGYPLFVGSEMLIQGGSGYQEKNRGFNEGPIADLGWAAAPTTVAADYEIRISRHATYVSDGEPVFANDTIALILESEDANFARRDTAPDIEGIEYTFTAALPPLGDSIDLLTLGTSEWRFLTNSAPDSTWKNSDFDDSTWSSGAGAFGYPAQGAPATVHTPLPEGTTNAYFRSHFQWNNDSTGVVLVASTVLRDGAIFYLNGQEVRRLRMPAGEINSGTPATGGHISGVEIFGIDPQTLVPGDNVFAVEVHDQIQGAADFYFDLGLLATTNYPVVITDSTQPTNRTVVAGQSTTFNVEVLGSTPITFQWLKDNQPIENATNSTFTIASVLNADAGLYSVRVTNQNGGTVITSREAQLTVQGTPVVIVSANLPADVTTTEGLSVSFTVEATGSAPLTYQWFKGAQTIEGATNNMYSITNVVLADAGDYHVDVTNPVNTLSSRTAHLTVNRDLTAPAISSVSGSPNSIVIQFNEPVEEASATNAQNFQLSGGVTVQTATLDTNNPSRVVLSTTGQSLGTNYTLTISGVKDRFNNVIAASSRTFSSTIVIDGNFSDWTGLEIAHTDPQESPAAGTDFKDVWVYSDTDFIYVRFTLYQPGDPTTFLNNIFIDADNSIASGYGAFGIGSEILIQSGAGYQEKNGGFNEGGVNDLDFAIAPAGQGTDFELRISRKAKFANDNSLVFTNDTIRLVLETENSSFATTDTAPDALVGGLEVTLAQGPLAELQASLQGSNILIQWQGPGLLQTRSSLTTGDWQDITDAPNPYSTNALSGNAFFRLRSETP